MADLDSKCAIGKMELRRRLAASIESGDLSTMFLETQSDRDTNLAKRRNQREIMKSIRTEVGGLLHAQGFPGSVNAVSWSDVRRHQLPKVGRHWISLVAERSTARIADQWSSCPEAYPFYTSFVEAAVFHMYHAAARPNEAIDTNAQPDYEQLCYLLKADVIVSNDLRFMKSVFDALWAPKGKRFMTCEQFVEMVERLVH